MGSHQPAVALIGSRTAAVRAAVGLGLPVVLVTDRAPPRRVAGAVTEGVIAPLGERDGPGTGDGWRRAVDACRRLAVAAVVPLIERAVVPAARLAAELELPGLPIAVARRATDKVLMKRAARRGGLATADWVGAAEGASADELVERLGLPLVVKPRASSGSRGTRVVRERREVPERLPAGTVAESFVAGREMSVETLLADGRIRFTNFTEYLEPGWASLVPAALAASETAAVRELRDGAHRALGLTGGRPPVAMTHLELFLPAAGSGRRPVFGELAARPPGGHLMDLVALAYGFDPWRALVELALGREPALPDGPSAVAAVRLLHPGPGRVLRVDGLEAAAAVDGVERVSCRLRPGDEVGPRAGVGEEVGHLLVRADDRAGAVAALAEARRRLVVEVDPAG